MAAADYTFNYTLLEGGVVTGSFSGAEEGDFILGISNIAVSYNGTAFDGTINAYGYFGYMARRALTPRRRRISS